MSELENATTTTTEVVTQGANTQDIPAVQKLTAEQLESMTKEDLDKFINDVEGTAQAIIQEAKQALVSKENEVKEGLVTWDVQFRQNQGISIQVAVIGAAFVLFEVLSAIDCLLGVK
jgi:hypothetical protein